MKIEYRIGKQDVEQVTSDGKITLGKDNIISLKNQSKIFEEIFGKSNVELRNIVIDGKNKKCIVVKTLKKEYLLLTKNISYLGLPHPGYKKRIQIPCYYKDIVDCYHQQYEIRFIGIYYRNDTIILVDFLKETYMQRKTNNSSAHVLTVDLFHAQERGIYVKEDYNQNKLFVIRFDKFRSYLLNEIKNDPNESMFSVFKNINKDFPFNQKLTALKITETLFKNGDSNWNQAEWPGFYVEYFYKTEIMEQNLSNQIIFQMNKKKKSDSVAFDFDLFLPELNIYGDLKASSINKKEVTCNDKKSMERAVEKYGKIWYIVYEHDTEKDSKENEYSEVIKVNQLKNSLAQKKIKDDLSYKNRMKVSVNFKKMYVIELNKANIIHITEVFKQGKNSNGKQREDKLKFKKALIDNYVIYQYESGDVK